MARNAHTYQERFWRELVQLKVQLQYLSTYQYKTERIDSSLRMFSAVASSSSIAAWAVWQEAQIVWAVIIAASQLLSAIKEHLPFQKRLRQVSNLGLELAEIFVFAEHRWYSVAEGKLTNSEIHDLTTEIKRRIASAAAKHLKDATIPPSRKLRRETRQQVVAYFRNHYGIGV